jgi:hypothetical protein
LVPLEPAAAWIRAELAALGDPFVFAFEATRAVHPVGATKVAFFAGMPQPASSMAPAASVVIVGSWNVPFFPLAVVVPAAVPDEPAGHTTSTPL